MTRPQTLSGARIENKTGKVNHVWFYATQFLERCQRQRCCAFHWYRVATGERNARTAIERGWWFRRTKASSTMVIAAHPGDAFFAMGAPVALATRQRAEGFLLSLTLGEKGSATIPPEQYGEIQRSAAQKAAAQIGATAGFLHYPDGEVPINDEAKFAVCDMIRQFKPDIVVTHWKGSWHKDHRACYAISKYAIFYAALPTIRTKTACSYCPKIVF